jgi:hypothetical protein
MHAIYDLSTGEILKQLTLPVEMLQLNYDAETQGCIDIPHAIDYRARLDLETLEVLPISVQPTQEEQEEFAAELAQQRRRELLAACDWTQLPDVPEQTRLAWQVYRQELRDITLQAGYPVNIEWPLAPH